MHQLPSPQEKEELGPIAVKAGEQLTMTTRMLQTRTTATTTLSSLQRLWWGHKTKSAAAMVAVTAAAAVGSL
jgi:hypothetical protein